MHGREPGKRRGSASRVAALLLVLAAAYGYGVATARYRLFPYGVLEALHTRLFGREVKPPAPEDRRPGLWIQVRRDAADGGARDLETLRELGELGYMEGYEPAPAAGGVTIHDPSLAHAGFNLVVSGHRPEASLQDMDGATLHAWHHELVDIWPDLTGFLPGYETFWRRAHAYPNGDLLAIFDGIGLIKLDRDSNLIWAHLGNEHHDAFVDEDGTIYTLSRHERETHDRLRLDGPIEEDFISILTPDGREVRRVSVVAAFLDSDYGAVLAHARKQGDILHTNTIELMDGRFADRHPMFAKGNALISVRNLNTVAVVDLETERVVWALAGMWQMQHQPTVVGDGNLLVFDNLGHGGQSKVVEVDPITQEIVWAYRSTPEHPLNSWFLGSCQRLPNGNTLITESTAGRALEVTGGGEIVWEFVNPQRAGEEDELIASLFEVVRIERDYFAPEFATLLNERDVDR